MNSEFDLSKKVLREIVRVTCRLDTTLTTELIVVEMKFPQLDTISE